MEGSLGVVDNGGFEDGLGGWWNATEEYPKSRYKITTESVYQGEHALELSIPFSPQSKAFISQDWSKKEGSLDDPYFDIPLNRNYSLSFAVFFVEGNDRAEFAVRLDSYYVHEQAQDGRTSSGSGLLIEYVVGTGERPELPHSQQLLRKIWGTPEPRTGSLIMPIQRCEPGEWYHFTVYPVKDLRDNGVDVEALMKNGRAYGEIILMLVASGGPAAVYVDAVELNVPESTSNVSLDVKPKRPMILEGVWSQEVKISGSVVPNPGAREKVLIRYQMESEEEYSWHYVIEAEIDSNGRYTATWRPSATPIDRTGYIRVTWESSSDYAARTASFTYISLNVPLMGAVLVVIAAVIGLYLRTRKKDTLNTRDRVHMYF